MIKLPSIPDPSLPIFGKKILIAEDDEVNAMIIGQFVEELGGQVLKASDGNEAVTIAAAQKPDIIFMDIHMPYFSGIEAIKKLRSENFMAPIISLSASSRLLEKQQSSDAGATGFLNKPAKRELIHKILLKYLA
jgi:CheY-like chemotaxis protein